MEDIIDIMQKRKLTIFDKIKIRQHFKRDSVQVIYGINTNIMSKNKTETFVLVYDFMPDSDRAGVTIRRNIKTILTRSLSDLEYDWLVAEYGVLGQRFYKLVYSSIKGLVSDDLGLGVVTPDPVIQAAKNHSFIIKNDLD